MKVWTPLLLRACLLSAGLLSAGSVLLASGQARAQATIAECEKIQAADAYNQCLAKFGPPMKGGNLEPERPGDVKAGPAEAAAGAGKAKGGGRRVAGHRRGGGRAAVARRGRGGGHVARAGKGRQRMTITVGK